MGILSMLGIVPAEEHAKTVLELDAAKAERDDFKDRLGNEIGKGALLSTVIDAAKAAKAKAEGERDEAVRKLATVSNELATFHARRDRDNEKRKLRRSVASETTKPIASPKKPKK